MKGQEVRLCERQWGFSKCLLYKCHCVHKCNTIGLSSFCIAPMSVPKVEVGEQAAVPIAELGKQRVNLYL